MYLSILKIPNRAAQSKQRGCMQPASRQFDMPAVSARQLCNYLKLERRFGLQPGVQRQQLEDLANTCKSQDCQIRRCILTNLGKKVCRT